MYGYDYSYEPAMESSSFFNAVKELIRNTQEKIKDFMEKVKTKLRRLMGNKDQIVEDSARAREIIKDLGKNISDLLDDCCKSIDALYVAYSATSEKGTTTTDTDATIDLRAGKMDSFKAKSDAAKKEWNETKIHLGEKFSENAKNAEKISKDIKELKSMGKLSYNATKEGYNELRRIFNANGTFGERWKKVQVAADWSTGGIKESLNKVVSLYKVGVNATNAFGNRLIAGFYSDESGDRLDKEERKANMRSDKNRIKIHKEEEGWNDISTKSKDLKDVKITAQQAQNAFEVLAKVLTKADNQAPEDVIDQINNAVDALINDLSSVANDTDADVDAAIAAVRNMAMDAPTAAQATSSANATQNAESRVETVVSQANPSTATKVKSVVKSGFKKIGNAVNAGVSKIKRLFGTKKSGNESAIFDPNYFDVATESYDDFDFEMEMMDFEHSYIGSDDIFDENFF